MFKKLFLLGAAAALAFAVGGFSTTAQAAGIAGTAHEFNGTGGACATCHLPHGAQGKRLWVQAPNTGAGIKGAVAPLCASCHYNTGSLRTLFGFHTNRDQSSTSWVFGTNSHGVLLSTATPPANTYFSELPYHKSGVNTLGVIECTTCHDVHNNDVGRNPFLRKSMGVLCATCHGLRQYNTSSITGWAQGNVANIGTLGNWNTGTNLGLRNPGSHPVGLDITGNIVADAPITIWRGMRLGFAASRGKWSSGGHLSSGQTGGMTCATCHSVHGVRIDNGTGGGVAVNNNSAFTQTGGPAVNMLAVSQAVVQNDANGRSIANGASDRNALCESCHVGVAAAAVYQATATTGTSPFYWPNPGNTAYGHPVDNMRIQGDWVPGAPTGPWPTASLNWPVGGSTATSASAPNVICESCHVAHPNANAGRVDLATPPARATSNQYILRSRAADVCWACHTDSLKNHHPVGKRYNTVGVPYLAGVKSNAMDTLECGSCHGGQGAHNWSGRGAVGLDPAWRPTNNGRTGAQATEMYNAVASLTCMDCHGGMMGAVKGNDSPSLHGTFDSQYAPLNMTEVYTQLGGGSHAMGRIGGGGTGTPIRQTYPVASYWASLNARLNPGTNGPFVNGNVWTAARFQGQGGWSVFGGSAASPVLVCESCHELQPTRNATTHLLLGYYAEEPNVPPIASTRSQFCEGCHMPNGTHQQTGETVTRSNQILSTTIDAVNRPWLVQPTDTNVVLSGGNRLTCDTCHQPHDAATNSTTFILDVDNTRLGAILTDSVFNATIRGSVGSYTGYWPTVQFSKGGDHSGFCKQCHQY